MIGVYITINGIPILARTAVRREGKEEPYTYDCDDGTVIQHYYNDGAAVLAKKMLDTLIDAKVKRKVKANEKKCQVKESNSV